MCIIQMFDSYGNHVPKGLEVTITLTGFILLNHLGTVHQVMLLYQLWCTVINMYICLYHRINIMTLIILFPSFYFTLLGLCQNYVNCFGNRA